jgi:Uma2 family endonuclease
MATTERITTAEQLLQAHGLGRCELLRGELIMMSPGGLKHAFVISNINRLLADFVRQNAIGWTFAEAGFLISRNPDTVRAPDVAFITRDHCPAEMPDGYFHQAPDLAVEVISPNDRASEVLAKVRDWLDAGCQMVWVADPGTRSVTVYRGETVEMFRPGDQLTGGDLLPGFRLAVAEIFA